MVILRFKINNVLIFNLKLFKPNLAQWSSNWLLQIVIAKDKIKSSIFLAIVNLSVLLISNSNIVVISEDIIFSSLESFIEGFILIEINLVNRTYGFLLTISIL
jgi:hypothetical protein